MKLLIFSDSHGERALMKQAINTQRPDMVLHLGDHSADFKAIRRHFMNIDFKGVRGNCDFRTDAEESLYFNIEGRNVFMTHGHVYNVKIGYERILWAALEKKADILLFGHTHNAYRDCVRGIHVLNPGSIGRGEKSYGIVELLPEEVITAIIPVP
jgi:putative phosphoesterase